MRSYVGVNDPQAVKKWASLMAVAINKSSYWAKKFVGEGKDARLPVQRIDDLESGAGDEGTVDLLMRHFYLCLNRVCSNHVCLGYLYLKMPDFVGRHP